MFRTPNTPKAMESVSPDCKITIKRIDAKTTANELMILFPAMIRDISLSALTLCSSELWITTKIPPKIRLAKFSIEKNPATTSSEIDCREYLADRITLK